MSSCQVFQPGCRVQGKEVTFFVDTGEGGVPEFRIAGPSRTDLTYRFHEATSMYDATFLPYFAGKYELAVSLNDEPIRGSPFVITVKEQDGYQPPNGDASKVKAEGEGLESCVVDQPAFFTLHTSDAGVGRLRMEIEGPSEAMLAHDELANQVGTFRNEYVVQEAGTYMLYVMWSGNDIPGSPFTITATAE